MTASEKPDERKQRVSDEQATIIAAWEVVPERSPYPKTHKLALDLLDARARIAELTRERDEAREERDDRADFMRRRGYRECDMLACNCNSWHGGHADDRLSEIRYVIDGEGGYNGVTTIEAIRSLFADRDRLTRELDEAIEAIRFQMKTASGYIHTTAKAVLDKAEQRER